MNIEPREISRILAQNTHDGTSTCPPLPGVDSAANQPAAVLIPLLLDGGVWKVLFIKRTSHQADRHSGQIAFPGGRFDIPDRGLQQTALREASEEIGIDPKTIQVLGQSCSMTTVTGYTVTPFAGILTWPTNLALSPDEVEKILLIPVSWLADPGNRRVESWHSPAAPHQELPVVFFREFEGEVLWGATARILVDFLDLIQGTAARV